MTSFWLPWSPFLRPFYMCKFLCRWISLTICLLRNLYIWERSPFIWYPTFFQATLSFIYNSLVAPSLSRECFSYFYSHLCALTFHWRFFSSCSSRWVCWFCCLNVLTCSLFFRLVEISNWYLSACEHFFKKIFFVSCVCQYSMYNLSPFG